MSATTTEIVSDIRKYVIDRFLFGDAGVALTNEESMFDRGIVDSTGVLELVMFLEERFGISVQDSELIPDNLESVAKAAAFITRKIG